MSQNKLRYILLDLGGVVFNATGISSALIKWETISLLNHKYGHDLNIGKATIDSFLHEYNMLTGLSLDSTSFLQNLWDILDFNSNLVYFLQKHAPIAILSDNYRENIEYISGRFHFEKWAVRQFYSYHFGVAKYEGPEIYQKVLSDLDVSAEEVIFIDDSPGKLSFASDVGFRTILFKDNDQLMEDFEIISSNW